MSIEATVPALGRFIDESRIVHRLAVMPLLNAEMRGSDSTFDRVLKVLDEDASLSGFIRHAACSAYFGGRDVHCTVREAFSRMGITEFHRTVSTAVIHTRLSHAAFPHFVGHSDQVARLCELIAGHRAKDLVVEAYFAGLCHDAAVPAMTESLTDYQYLADQALSHDPGVLELETECNGFTHCEAGAEIVKLMGFPADVATAVKYHHEPQRLLDLTGAAARLLSMIILTERVMAVAHDQLAGVFVEPVEDEIQQSCWQALELDAGGFQTLTNEMLEFCRLRRAHG